MKLSKSIEDYLETILLLEKQTAKTVKSVDIASSLNVSKPAVTKAMNELKELGFINKDLYGEIHRKPGEFHHDLELIEPKEIQNNESLDNFIF